MHSKQSVMLIWGSSGAGRHGPDTKSLSRCMGSDNLNGLKGRGRYTATVSVRVERSTNCCIVVTGTLAHMTMPCFQWCFRPRQCTHTVHELVAIKTLSNQHITCHAHVSRGMRGQPAPPETCLAWNALTTSKEPK